MEQNRQALTFLIFGFAHCTVVEVIKIAFHNLLTVIVHLILFLCFDMILDKEKEFIVQRF